MDKNYLEITGNLGRDPKVFTTKDGKTMAKCSIAHNEEYNGVKKTIWVSVTFFGSAAEAISKMIKGNHVLLIGKLDLVPTWTKTDGTVVPESLGMVCFKIEGTNIGEKIQPSKSVVTTQMEKAVPMAYAELFEDDIQF